MVVATHARYERGRDWKSLGAEGITNLKGGERTRDTCQEYARTTRPRNRERLLSRVFRFSFIRLLPSPSPLHRQSASQRGSLDPRASPRNGVYIPSRRRISIRASKSTGRESMPINRYVELVERLEIRNDTRIVVSKNVKI